LFSPGTPVSSTNKTDRHDIAEILLKVALNIINQKPNHFIEYHIIEYSGKSDILSKHKTISLVFKGKNCVINALFQSWKLLLFIVNHYS